MPGTVVLVLGLANLVADGFAMGAGSYSGTKADLDDYRRLLAVERKHIALEPSGEREEIRQIFGSKGFSGAELEGIVDVITANEDRWAKTMAVEEYGLAPVAKSPIRAAFNTSAAFRAMRTGAAGELSRGLSPLLVRGRDRPRVLRNRGDEEPLVVGGLDVIRVGDADYRHECSHSLVLHRLRIESSRAGPRLTRIGRVWTDRIRLQCQLK
jgi:hypothetical protein